MLLTVLAVTSVDAGTSTKRRWELCYTQFVDRVFKFPDGFLWGATTSAHQVEGGNRNDWTEWEQANAERLAREAASKFSHLQNWPEIRVQAEDPANYISGRACDHYYRFREDFDIAKQLGHNAHRFSIEWSRIEPEEGRFDEVEIEHYREVIAALRERGMEPFVTLWHYTLPLWVRDQRRWENKKTIQDFIRYTRYVVGRLKDVVRFWIPLNEPSIYAGMAYAIGVFPPQVRSYRRTRKVLGYLSRAHALAYASIHELQKEAKVGSSYNLHWHEPSRKKSPLDRLAVRVLDAVRDGSQLRGAERYNDFLGLNYYFRDRIRVVAGGGRFGLVDIRNPNEWVSDRGWDIAPEGIYRALQKLKRFRLPIYVTENGIADARDKNRVAFIRKHLTWLAKAMQEGIDVRGYLYWSLLDNFEWDNGFWPRFGLVEVDYKTLQRRIRPSALEYKKIIEANAIDV